MFDAPTSPISTPERTLYRRRLPHPLATGDTLILDPIPGWLEQPVTWILPPEGPCGIINTVDTLLWDGFASCSRPSLAGVCDHGQGSGRRQRKWRPRRAVRIRIIGGAAVSNSPEYLTISPLTPDLVA